MMFTRLPHGQESSRDSTAMSADSREYAFLPCDSPMAERVRRFDWSATPLGPIDRWPPALRVAAGLVLASRFPSCLAWGPELTTLYNDAFAPILGDKPESLGRSFRDVWHEVWATVGPLVARAMAGESIYIVDMPLQVQRFGHAEQARFTFCYSPVRDETGAVTGMVDTVVETTHRHALEEALRRPTEDLERQVAARTADRNRMWQLSLDMMVVTRNDGVITAVNPSWTTILGWTEQESIGRVAAELAHPDEAEFVGRALAQLREGRPISRFESRNRCKDGSYRRVAWTAVPGDGYVYSVGRDITAEKENLQAMREMEESLRQSQKMQAVGQLTGGLAHDFNNLLMGISGSLELLAMRFKRGDTASLERYLETAQGATKRAAALTHRLLAFSRRHASDPKPADVRMLLEGMAELVQRTVGPAVQVKVAAPPGLWPVRVDANQLENSLLNLCINARDAMPQGGALSIDAGNVWLDEEAVRPHGRPPGMYVRICVTDTGVGMDDETIARVFDPFFTTKPAGQGTGLGLSMVYGFVHQSDGMIEVQSQPGRGTTVSMYFPRCLGAAPAPGGQAGAGMVPTAVQGQTVLVVDDEVTVRALTNEVLGELGYTVIEAADGAAALAVLESDARLDLLIADVGLPGPMNGRQVAATGRTLRPGLKVLFITGYAESAVLQTGELDQGMEILTKPFAFHMLAERVNALLTQDDRSGD